MVVSSDLYGLPVTANEPARDAWLQGIQASLGFDHSGIDELKTATAADPEFALAHACLAKQQWIHGLRDDAMQSLGKAVSLSDSATARESSHIKALHAALTFDSNALNLALEHVQQWPLDIIVLSSIVGPFGLLAFSGRASWQTDSLALLNANQQLWPADDWWFMAARGFALGELGQLDQAIQLAERAWQLQPTGNCAHTLSHVHFEQDALQEGHAFLQGWIDSYGKTSDMRHHLVWHRALIDLANGDADQASMAKLYRDELDPAVQDPMPLTTFADNASILWRCQIYAMAQPIELAEQASQYADKFFPGSGFAFADMHKMALAALMQSDGIRMLEQLEQLNDDSTRQFFKKLWQGFSAFVARDFATVVHSLEPVLQQSVRLGGSNPQRNLIKETYAQARANLTAKS